MTYHADPLLHLERSLNAAYSNLHSATMSLDAACHAIADTPEEGDAEVEWAVRSAERLGESLRNALYALREQRSLFLSSLCRVTDQINEREAAMRNAPVRAF